LSSGLARFATRHITLYLAIPARTIEIVGLASGQLLDTTTDQNPRQLKQPQPGQLPLRLRHAEQPFGVPREAIPTISETAQNRRLRAR
jgi:hypothetical protein